MKANLETLVHVIYVLGFPAAFYIGHTFGNADRFGSHAQSIMPMLIGLICLAPVVILIGWTRLIAPRTTPALTAVHAIVFALLLIPPIAVYVLLLPFPMFLASLFVAQREARLVFEAWLRSNDYVAVPEPPAAVLDKLGHANSWRCYANAFRLADGRRVPYLLWEGTGGTTAMVSAGGSTMPARIKHGLIAFSLPADEAGEHFVREIESQHLNTLTFWQRLKPSNQRKYPCLAERLPDGTFVAEWQCQHIAPLVEDRMQILRAQLEKSSRPPGAIRSG